jgi:WD40 repeat protein
VKFVQSKGSHTKDVISLDINEDNALATASIDNVISFWNTFIAKESKVFKLPRSLVAPENN